MNIFHISSFFGNSGDVLSNYGFSKFMASEFPDANIARYEVRKIYRNYDGDDRKPLYDLLKEASKTCEVIVLGGGGFFDYWVPGSASGTTFDISAEELKKIDAKIVFSSLGAYPHKLVPEGNIDKFDRFLSDLTAADNVSVMLRNDGSYEHLSSTISSLALEAVSTAADHAYLCLNHISPSAKCSESYVAINVAPDQLSMVSEYRLNDICDDFFYKEIAKAVLDINANYGHSIVFVPHLINDYFGIQAIIDYLPDTFVRRFVSVAEYKGTPSGLDALVNVYGNSEFNVCTRFHSNILSIILDQPTICLAALDRVASVAEQYNSCRIVRDFEKPFSTELLNAPHTSKNDKEITKKLCVAAKEFLSASLSA